MFLGIDILTLCMLVYVGRYLSVRLPQLLASSSYAASHYSLTAGATDFYMDLLVPMHSDLQGVIPVAHFYNTWDCLDIFVGVPLRFEVRSGAVLIGHSGRRAFENLRKLAERVGGNRMKQTLPRDDCSEITA